MKPVKLTIGGLNSFESPQTIDFEALSSKGLFGIFGPTGSGKSTIIDGIVISLYGPGSIPRGTKDFINTECEQAELEFVFRTAVEGVVREIEVRRVLRRSGEGYRSHQSRLVLKTLEGEVLQIEDKQNEVNRRLQEILGLSESEFLKMVVLPQGKFSEFIQLDPKDRRSMLQNLFGLEIYGDRLTERLKKVTVKLQSQRDQLEGQLTTFEGVDQARLEGLMAETARLEAQTEIREREAQRLKVAFDAMCLQFDRQKRLQSLKEAEKRHAAAHGDHLAHRARLERYEKAAAAVESERHFKKSQEAADELRHLEAEAAQRYMEAKTAFEQHDVVFKNLEKAYAELPVKRHDAAQIRNKWLQVKSFNQLKIEREKTAALDGAQRARCEAERQKLEGLNQAIALTTESINLLTALQAREGMTLEASEALMAALERKEQRNLERTRLGALVAALEESGNELKRLDQVAVVSQERVGTYEGQLQETMDTIEALTARREALRDRLEQIQEKRSGHAAALEALQTQVLDQNADAAALESLRAALKERSDQLEASREIYNASLAARLRADLADGEVCPVCGHVYNLVEERLDGTLDSEWLRQFEKEDQALAVLRHQENQLETTIAQRQLQLDADGESACARIDALEAEGAALDQTLASLRTERECCDLDLEALKQKQGLLQSQLKLMRAQFEADHSRLSAQRQAHAVLLSKSDAAQAALAQHEEALMRYLEGWHGRTSRDALEERSLELLFSEALKLKTLSERRVKELTQLQARLAQESDEKIRQLQAVNLCALENERLSADLKQMEGELSRLSREIGDVADEESLEAALKSLNLEIDGIEAAYPVASAKQAALLEAHERLRGEWISREAALKSAMAQLEVSRQRFEEKWRGAGFDDEADWRSALLSPEEGQALGRWIQDYEVEGRTLREKMEEYRDLEGVPVITESVLEREGAAAEAARQAWARSLEARSTAAEAMKTMTQALVQKSEVEKQLSETKRETGYFEILQKLLRGNRFVEFLAMNQLDYILQEASKRLMAMTANRYRLEVDSRGNFRISDHHQGGVSRDLRSLSGGETFMASLALALAMSSRLQLRGRIRLETFLLDEGFGSLDTALLDVVMHALETLIGDQLSVGLISHVEALKARVPVRLDVKPAEPGVSGTSVQTVMN